MSAADRTAAERCQACREGVPNYLAPCTCPAVPATGDVEGLAVALCEADESWEHHDASDDHPCSRCKALAVRILPYVAAVRRETAERIMPLDRVQAVVTHLVSDGTREGLFLADELNKALGASSRRRIAREDGAR